MLKRIIFALLALVLMLGCCVSAFAEAAPDESSSDTSEAVESVESADDESAEEESEAPKGFLGNIKYMGLGMLGIFVVIGVVIIITIILNTATSKKQ